MPSRFDSCAKDIFPERGGAGLAHGGEPTGRRRIGRPPDVRKKNEPNELPLGAFSPQWYFVNVIQSLSEIRSRRDVTISQKGLSHSPAYLRVIVLPGTEPALPDGGP